MHPLISRKIIDLRYKPFFKHAYYLLKLFEYALHRCLNVKSIERNVVRYLKLCKIGNKLPKDITKCASLLINLKGYGNYTKNDCAKRSIVLKNPIMKNNLVVEKGVLLLTFTHCFEYFLKDIDTNKLLRDFRIVLEPSWSGYCVPSIIEWINYPQHKIVVQATEVEDFDFLINLNRNLIPVNFGASDWVDDRLFYPLHDVEKVYDAIYVAVYGAYKRHHVLFRSVKKIKEMNPRIAIVGVPWMGTKEEILWLIEHYDIKAHVDIFESLSPDELNIVLNKSKLNLLLSLQEGSNRSIFEGLFSNVPGVVLKNNKGMQKSYINSSTGLLIDESELSNVLLHFRESWRDYNPRDWALRNISPLITTEKLNDVIKKIAINDNEPWTCDIVPKVNAPEVKYYFDEHNNKFTKTIDLFDRYAK